MRWTTEPGRRRLAVHLAVDLALLTLLLDPFPAIAQPPSRVLEEVESIDFDRPEAWAMKYFTSLSLMTGLGTSGRRSPGEVEWTLEGGLVPSLGEEKRRVGFVGNKVEDLNRTSVFGRARATVGLPGSFNLTLGAAPPLEVDGVTPWIFGFALGRQVREIGRWTLELRLHGQLGRLEGDLTCPAAIAGLEDRSLNPDACLEASNDEMSQRTLGLEMMVGRVLGEGRWEPYASLSVQRMDLEFQVDAQLAAFHDRTRLETDGVTWSLTGGVVRQLEGPWRLAGELFYTPLEVVRDAGRGARNDELFSGRLAAVYSRR